MEEKHLLRIVDDKEQNPGVQDFDNILGDFFAAEFKREHRRDCTTSTRAMRWLRTQCDRAKRTEDLLIGLVGILKTGAAYLPLDPDFPLERLRFMLEAAAVPVYPPSPA